MSTVEFWRDGLLDPQGPVASAQGLMLANATLVMLAVIVPVILAVLAFAWWFRAGNARARRRPDWSYSGRIEVVVWSIPLLVIMFLGSIAWLGSHALDPRKPLQAEGEPLDIQVVSLDWKWLFLYPGQGVATVGQLVVPAGRSLRLSLTSASVMNSFLVPQLGGQIYTMAGMTTRLHLLADRPGRYPGLSAQISGEGFSDMRFDTIAMSPRDFAEWHARVRRDTPMLDESAYARLARPSTTGPAAYGSVMPGLFDAVVAGQVPAAAAGAAGAGRS